MFAHRLLACTLLLAAGTARAADSDPPAPNPAPVEDHPAAAAGVRLGVSGLGSPGGAGGHAALELGFSWSVVSGLALELEGLVTMAGDSIARHGAFATLDLVALRGWLVWEVLGQSWFRPALGVGGGLLLPRARGLTTRDYAGASDLAAVGYLGGLIRAALVLSESVWLRLGLRLGLSLPEVEVRFVDRLAARFGRPLVEGFGALELRF